jgi:transcriptional regulator with XRE-family HTH domain
MSAISLSNLGTMVRKKRGAMKLRVTAATIGISAATLMRVESGRIPDVETFGKLCLWLGVDPGQFLGFKNEKTAADSSAEPLSISAHFKADKTPKPKTVTALAKMILLAMRSQPAQVELELDDENT